MKPLLALLLLTTPLVPADEKALSETDRQLLLERLKEIQDTSSATVESRHQLALSAFRKGRSSDSAAHDLYLNCVEKVRFEDQLRKSSEFRDWKLSHRERTDTEAFRRALRHQLNWLALTIEAINAEDGAALASKAQDAVANLLEDAETLKTQQELLGTSVLQSIFAEAYSITTEPPANWPDHPLDLDTLYDQLILPPLRNKDSLESLRKMWLKRIEHEGTLVKQWTEPGSADDDRKPAFEKWQAVRQKELAWRMEVDLFRHGNQKESSIRMLEHLKKNMAHESAPTWIAEFTTLVEGRQGEPTETPSQ